MKKDIIFNMLDNNVEIKASLSMWGYVSPSSFAKVIAKLNIRSEDISLINEIFSETAVRERYYLYNFFAKIWQGNTCVVEVGSFLGGTTRSIALGMLHNSNFGEARFITIDRFESYHRPKALEEKAKKLIVKYASDDETVSEIRQGNWLRLFKATHEKQIYGEFLEIVKAKLPDRINETFPKEISECFDSIDSIAVLFIDGCKSWYATKSLMIAALPKMKIGNFIIFQDYGRHTCFWITAFCEVFTDHFELIGSIAGTYTFRYIKELAPNKICLNFPDSPHNWSKDQFHTLYQNALDKAFLRNDSSALVFLTIQMAAAFAYIGFKDEARYLINLCVVHPSMQLYKENSISALKTPTFTPDSPIYLDE